MNRPAAAFWIFEFGFWIAAIWRPLRMGGFSGNETRGSDGMVVVTPCSTFTGTDLRVTVPDFSPALFARILMGPASRVERSATRLIPPSRSSHELLMELVLPLL